MICCASAYAFAPGEKRAVVINRLFSILGRSHHRADEFLYLRLADGLFCGPALCLYIDQVEPQFIFVDDAVDAIIAAAPGDETVSVVHRLHQVDHKISKNTAGCAMISVSNSSASCLLMALYTLSKVSRCVSSASTSATVCASPPPHGLRIPRRSEMFCQQSVCDLNAALQQLLSLICDGKIPSLKRFDAACLFEICPCPTHAIVKNRLPAAGRRSERSSSEKQSLSAMLRFVSFSACTFPSIRAAKRTARTARCISAKPWAVSSRGLRLATDAP